MKDFHIIGWRERIDLPQWKIQGLLAKSDTGANSSAIDVAWLEELPEERVRFGVRCSQKDPQKIREIEAPVLRRTRIRSSNGQRAHRIFVITKMRIGVVSKRVEFGLVCRKNMICRVLLGRKALEGDFLVDCSERHIHARATETKSELR